MGEKHGAACIDRELLFAMSNGSDLKGKVTQIFEILQEPVYRYLYRALGDPEEARDLTQETFLRLHAYLAEGQSVENLRAWIFRVAHNLAINQQKKINYRESFHCQSFDGSLPDENRDPELNAEQRLLKQEEAEGFRAVIAKLPPHERQCLDLRAEGLSYREIAEVLGMRLSTLVKFYDRIIIKLMRQTYDESST